MRQSWKLLLLAGVAMITAMMVGASAASRAEQAATLTGPFGIEASGYGGLMGDRPALVENDHLAPVTVRDR